MTESEKKQCKVQNEIRRVDIVIEKRYIRNHLNPEGMRYLPFGVQYLMM